MTSKKSSAANRAPHLAENLGAIAAQTRMFFGKNFFERNEKIGTRRNSAAQPEHALKKTSDGL
jgi:hypothetical protein